MAEDDDRLEAGSQDVIRICRARIGPRRTNDTRRERRRLTHVSRSGRPRMVDVSEKPATARKAVAEAFVSVEQETLTAIIDGAVGKGDVLTVAEMAGVMGAKRTSELIPLCHPIPLTDLVVEITPERAGSGLRVRATAATVAPTGVEMEALTAASVAALTVYDMVKGVDRGAYIRDVRLLEKSGGKSGEWHRPDDGERGSRSARCRRQAALIPQARRRVTRSALVLTISDGVTAGARVDESGEALAQRLSELGFKVERAVVPDDPDDIATAVTEVSERVDLIISTGERVWAHATARRRPCTAFSITRSQGSGSRCVPTDERRRQWPISHAAWLALSARPWLSRRPAAAAAHSTR